MFLKKIRLKNFFSFGNYNTEIQFSPNDKIIYITGKNYDVQSNNASNGSGKSTIFESIIYSLFGKTQKNVKLDNIINFLYGKDCEAEIEFELNGNNIKISRVRKKDGFKNEAVIYVNDAELSSTTNTDLQKKFEEEVLGFGFDEFVNICCYSTDYKKHFFMLTPSARFDFFEKFFNLTILNKLKDLVSNDIKTIESNKIDLETDVKKIEKAISIYLEFIEKEKTNLKPEESEKLSEMISEAERCKERISFLKDDISKNNKELSLLESELNSLQKQINNLKKALNANICSFCFREIDDDAKENISRIINDYKKECETLSGKREKIKTLISETEKEYDTLLKNYEKMAKEIESITNKTKESKEKLQDLKKKIEEERNNYVNIKNKLNEIKVNLESLYILQEITSSTQVKVNLIRNYTKMLEELFNEFINYFSSDIEISIDDEMNLSIFNKTFGYNVDYGNLSQGEKKKIDICFIFSLYQLANMLYNKYPKLLIIDELFDSSLDEYSTEVLKDIIYNYLDVNQVFIITHKEVDSENVISGVRVIEVEKRNGLSYIKVMDTNNAS